MSRTTRSLATAAASIAVATAVAGCGGSSGGGSPSDPRSELTAGVQSLSDASVLTATVKLDTTAAQLKGLARHSGSTISSSAADAAASAQIVVETKKAGSNSDADFRAVVGGKTLFEVRGVAQSIYLQGDVQGVLSLLQRSSAFHEIQGRTAQMPAFVRDFIAGKWVSINKAALSGLAGQLGGSGSSSSSSPDQNKILAQLKGVLQRDVTVTRAGSDSRGDHLVVTGDTRRLATDLQKSVASTVPGGSVLGDRLTPGNTPARTLRLDAWVKDGALTELSIDFEQFAKPGQVPAGTTLPLVLTFARSGGDISAPPGATPVDLTQLGSLVGGLGGGLAGGSASGSSSG